LIACNGQRMLPIRWEQAEKKTNFFPPRPPPRLPAKLTGALDDLQAVEVGQAGSP